MNIICDKRFCCVAGRLATMIQPMVVGALIRRSCDGGFFQPRSLERRPIERGIGWIGHFRRDAVSLIAIREHCTLS